MMDYSQFGLMGLSALPRGFLMLLALVVAWSIVWKGIALWKAARNNHTAWFVVMLIVNSVGILEIIYIFFFSHKKKNNKQDTISPQ